MDEAWDLAREAALEVEAARLAERRYKEAAEAADPTTLPSGQRILRDVLPPLIAKINQAQAQAIEDVRSGKRLMGWEWAIQLLPADKLAFITIAQGLRTEANAITNVGASTLLRVATSICDMVQAEIEYQAWSERMEKEARTEEASARILRGFRIRYPVVDRKVWGRWRRKVADMVANPWPDQGDKIKFGATLVHLLTEAAPDYFSLEDRRVGGMQVKKVLALSAKVREMMADIEQRAAVSKPMYMPMVIPPRPWRYVNDEA